MNSPLLCIDCAHYQPGNALTESLRRAHSVCARRTVGISLVDGSKECQWCEIERTDCTRWNEKAGASVEIDRCGQAGKYFRLKAGEQSALAK